MTSFWVENMKPDRAVDEALRIGRAITATLAAGTGQGIDGLSLGHGLAGIALFLAELARRTSDQRVSDHLASVTRTLVDRVHDVPSAGGWASGRAGVAFAIAEAGYALHNPDLVGVGSNALKSSTGTDGRGDMYVGLSGEALLALRMARTSLESSCSRNRVNTEARFGPHA